MAQNFFNLICNLTLCRIKMLTPDHTTEPKQESSPANELGVAMSHEGC